MEPNRGILSETYLYSKNVNEQRKDSHHLDQKKSASDDGKNVIRSEIIQEIVRDFRLVQVWESDVEYHANVPAERT